MRHLEKKARRLDPVVEIRQEKFDFENDRLNNLRKKRLDTVAAMRAKQQEYMEGVARLNDERGTSNRLMLEALETGLDTVKNHWMKLYQLAIEIEREEKKQLEVMSHAHKELEAIKNLQSKYVAEHSKEMLRREQKDLDEHSLRKFARQP